MTVTGGATLNVGGELRLGRKESVPLPAGYLYISGADTKILVADLIECGRYGDGTIDMTGGYLHSDAQLRLAHKHDTTGTVYLRGGTIDLDADPGITVGGGLDAGETSSALIDISGDGTLILAGDQVSDIETFVDDGIIIAYGGQSTVLVTYDPGDDVTIVTALSLTKARDPSPADDATDVCRTAVLSWMPGEFADKHHVYFGTDFDDVNDANQADPRDVYMGSQDEDYYPLVGTLELEFGVTYYWRIDEANAPPDTTIFKGDVWQFTTEPVGYAIADITATASSVGEPNEDVQPVNTVNGSGLTDDLHSGDMTDMWLSVSGGGGGAGNPSPSGSTGPAWIAYELPRL